MSNKFSKFTKENIHTCAHIYSAAFSAPPWNEKWDQAFSVKRLSFLLGIPTSIAYCCKVDNEIVAFWMGYIEECFDELAVKEIVVSPNFQRQGIGTLIATHIEETANKLDLKKITLSTLKNTHMEEFYRKIGYKPSDHIAFMNKELT